MREPDDDKTQAAIVRSKGTVISHYRIVEKIGAGGMGEVYLAEDTELNRKVALKFLPEHLCQDADCRARFKREAQAAAKLNHPNIITVYEVSEFNGRPYFAMEHIEGESLSDVIRKHETPLGTVLDLSIQICEGLVRAHQAGIVHRDIKPSNILIARDGRAKILDFGLAAVKGDKKLTKTGTTLGTINYMSPEQTRGEALDYRSDIFSFGVVLYEMITGQLPFKGEHEPAIMYAIGFEEPEPLARYKSGVSPGLQSVVTKALAKQKAERYQHAEEMLADLKALLSQARTTPPVHSGGLRRTRLRMAVLASVLIVVVAGLFVLRPWEFGARSTPQTSAAENRLAIMYFDNLADPADSLRLGEIATDLLITNLSLSESQYLQVVSSQRLYDILALIGKEGIRRIDRSTATQVANRAQATRMILGNILQVAPEIVLTSQIIDVATGDVMASERVTGTRGDRIFSMIDRLSAEVKQDLSLPRAALNGPAPATADLTTHSPEAYRYYLEGVDLATRTYRSEAELSFEKALQEDSTFAMAYYQLARRRTGQEQKELIAKAVAYSDEISPRERHYIRSLDALVSGDLARATEEVRSIVRSYPRDTEALYTLAMMCRDRSQQVGYLNRALEIDSLFEKPYNDLALIYYSEGDYENALWAIDRYISLAAADNPNPYDTRAHILADNDRVDQAIESYEAALRIRPSFYWSLYGLGSIRLVRREYDRADSCYRRLCSSSDAADRSLGRLCLAYIPTHQGRLGQALEVLNDGIAADRMEGVVQSGATGRSGPAAKHLLKALVYEQRQEPEAALREMERYVAIRPGEIDPGQHTYARFLIETKDFDKADQVVATWAKAIEGWDSTRMRSYWYALGSVELARGNVAEAVVHLQKGAGKWPFFANHYTLGVAYLEAGRLGDAVTEFQEGVIPGLGPGTAFYSLWAVKARYLLGLGYEKSGWNDKAIEKYEEFLDIWKNADSGLKDVEDARARLARLKGKP